MGDTIDGDSQGNVISMDKYVGVKEMLRKAEQRLAEANVDLENTKAERDTFKTQVASLDEKFKPYVSPDDHKKVIDELETFKSASLEGKRSAFAEKYHLDVVTIKDMTEEQLKLVEIGAAARGQGETSPNEDKTSTAQTPTPITNSAGEAPKPKPDLSSGGGSSVPSSGLDVCKQELEEIKRK